MTFEVDSIRVQRPTKTLRELTLETMRDAILKRHFKPGDRLIERDLCEQLGVSRTIVREVLRHLETEGLISTFQSRGPIVSRTSTAEALQIYEIRASLESIAARACAELRQPTVADDLQTSLDLIQAAYKTKDNALVLQETTEFYRKLFLKSGKEIAWGIVSSLMVRINHLRSMTIQSSGRNLEGPRQMQRVIDAIRAGNGDEASDAAHEHVRKASEIASRMLMEQTSG